jgi:ribosome-binding factor A
MNERRLARLAAQIQETLAQVLLRDINDPDLGMVTITRVEVDAEFTVCKAYWSVLGDARARQASAGVLKRARGLCQRTIGKAIHTRTVPHLEFCYDEGLVQAARIDQLLGELKKEREVREAAQPPTGESPPPKPEA